jgi:hypothetical protein
LLDWIRMEPDGWKSYGIKGQFGLQAPPDAAVRLQEDEATVEVRLGPVGDETAILIANYPFKKIPRDRTEHETALRDAVTTFLDSMADVTGDPVTGTIDVVTTDPPMSSRMDVVEKTEKPRYYAEGVAEIRPGERILVRAYACLGEERFWLLHWNGPTAKRWGDVARIFASFQFA